jgi:hypothetical protein
MTPKRLQRESIFNELDEDDKDNIKKSKEFFNFIKNQLENNLDDAKENIYDKIDYHNNKITIEDSFLQHFNELEPQ